MTKRNRKLSFVLVLMVTAFTISVLSIASEEVQTQAENVQIIFDPINGHNHNGTNSAKLAANSVNTTQLVDNSVTNSKISGPISVSKGGTGLTSLGNANQVLRVNSGGTALEYATASSASGQDSDMNYKLSATIGDYSNPTNATASSETVSSSMTITQSAGGSSSIFDQGDNVIWTEKAETTSSELIGLPVTQMSFWLKKQGSPTGTASVGFFNGGSGSKTLSSSFGTIDISTLTTSFEKYTFYGFHTIVENDRFGILDENSDGADVMLIEYANTDVYNSTDSVVDRFIESPAGTNDWSPISSRDLKFEIKTGDQFDSTASIDGLTTTYWKSNSTDKPWLRLDLGANKDLASLAINLNRTSTNATSLKIYASTDTTFTSNEVIAYVNVSDFTDDIWRFILNNRLPEDRRYILIEAQENSCVLAINEVKYREITDWGRHFHAKRDVANMSSFLDSN